MPVDLFFRFVERRELEDAIRDVKYWFMSRLRDTEGATAGGSTDPPAEHNEIAVPAGLQEGQASLLQRPNQH